MTEEEKIIENQLKTLPAELQAAINAVPWKSSVKEIALLNKLSPEQTENLERETMFILYGFENPADYIKHLIQEVPTSEETATTIAEQVNKKILKAITDKVEKPEAEPTHTNLPMIEEGEVAHDVPHVEEVTTNNQQPTTNNNSPAEIQKPTVQDSKPKETPSTPNNRYPGGIDPYREPIQ